MKSFCLRRMTSALLTLVMIAGLFAVCGTGAMAESTTVGAEIYSTDTSVLEYDHLMQIDVTDITIKKGHRIKLVYKMFAPGGANGKLMFRVYGDYSSHGAVADDDTIWNIYNAAETQLDPTYGYQYRLVEKTYDGPQQVWTGDPFWAEGETEKVIGFFNYIWILESNITEQSPIQFYEMSVYDVDDNNRLMYTLSGQDLSDASAHEGVGKRAIVKEDISAAVQAVSEKINAIDPANPDEQAVAAARQAYNDLTNVQKELVVNLAKLEAAEQALAEPDNVWDYKDLLRADKKFAMTGEYPDAMSVELPVGFQVDADVAGGHAEGQHLWPVEDFTSDEVTLVAGHRLRSVIRAYAPNGLSGSIIHHVYIDNQIKVIDDSCSYFGGITADETYGYNYQEMVREEIVPADAAGTSPLNLFIGNPGNSNYSQYPVQIFGWDLYDDTTGELLFSHDASDFLEGKKTNGDDCVKYHSPIQYNPVYYDQTIGYTATGTVNEVGCWTKYDIYTKLDKAPVEEGDILQMGVMIWKEDGWNDLQPFGMILQYYANALTEPDSNVRVSLEELAVNTESAYEQLEEYIDETYGFPYKLVTLEHAVTADEVECLNAKGVSPLIGHMSATNYQDSSLSLYGYYIYNVTQSVYYINIDGGSLASMGGSGTANELITVRRYNPEYALSGSVMAHEDAIFADLTSPSAEAGQYGYTFNVKGEANQKYLLKSYALDDQGDPIQVGQQTFTATGEQQEVDLLFNLRDPNAGKALTFGIETRSAALSVSDVSYNGRIGDFGEQDEYADQVAADPVIEQISALPSKLALKDEAAVNAAQTAYEALNDAQKALVYNIDLLTDAKAAIEALKQDKAAADKVTALINALPEPATPADADAVNEAAKAYEELTESQKSFVGQDAVDKLEAAKKAISIQYGDVNNDQSVDATDALWVLQHSVELRTLTETELKAADVTDLGKVDTKDALQILQKTVELIDQFDVEK